MSPMMDKATSVEHIPTREELMCLVCRQPGPDLDIDHVQAKGMGGSAERDVPENKVPLCRGHHNAKHQRVLQTRVRDGYFEWCRRGSDAWVRVPVRVNDRHGCLDFATEDSAAGEQQNTGGQTPKRASKLSAPPAAGSGRAPAEGDDAETRQPEPLTTTTRKTGSAEPSAAVLSTAAEAEESGSAPDNPIPVPRSTGLALGESSAAVPSLALPGTITPTSLTLPQNLSIEKWEKVGETLGNIHRASRFWIGDWLTFGEDAYHEKAAQAMDATGLEFETLANIASVCRRIPASRRRESLSFGHHAEVAAQESERQDSLLAEAEEQGWSRSALREAVSGTPAPKARHECPACGQDHVVKA